MKKHTFQRLLLLILCIQSFLTTAQNLQLEYAFVLEGNKDYDRGTNVVADHCGNSYVAGYFSSDSIDFDPSDVHEYLKKDQGFDNSFLAKYDAVGKLLWANTIKSSDLVHISDIAIDDGNNIYLTGEFSESLVFEDDNEKAVLTSNNEFLDLFIAKYNANGKFIFCQKIISKNHNYGSFVKNIEVYNNSSIYISGLFQGELYFGSSSSNQQRLVSSNEYFYNSFVAKYSANGKFEWAFKIGGDLSSNRIYGMAVDKNENIYVAGEMYRNAYFDPSDTSATVHSDNYRKTFLAKYNHNGEYNWAFALTSKESVSVPYDICVDKESNVYITGYLNGITDFDPAADKEFVNEENADNYIAKYSSEGDFIWVNYVKPSEDSYCSPIGIDYVDHTLLVCGHFKGDVHFTPSNEQNLNFLLTAKGERGYIAKYTDKGECMWSNSLYENLEYSYGFDVDHWGNIYLTGDVDGNAQFNLIDTSQYFSRPDQFSDIFLVKYSDYFYKTEEVSLDAIKVYPNPSLGEVQIEICGQYQHAALYDNLGRKVVDLYHSNTTLQLASGLYYIQATSKNQQKTTKLIVY